MSDDDAPRAKAFHPKRQINRKTKKHVVFDPEARKEFLTGFRKRKLERRKKAEEELKVQLKEERKRLQQEAKENLRKIVKKRQPAPYEDLPSQSYDLQNHSVSIVELSAADLAEKNNWIGPNRVQYEEKSEDTPKDEEKEELPGMELKTLRELKKDLKKKATQEVKSSKKYKQKFKIDQRKNKKKSMQLKRRQEKMRAKADKKRGKSRGKQNTSKNY